MFPVWVGRLAVLMVMIQPGLVAGRSSNDEIEALNNFCDIGMRLGNCTDEFLAQVSHERPALIHRNAIQFCCRQNKFQECDPSLEHRNRLCEKASKHDTCCIACGFGDEMYKLHPTILNCCRCREFKSLQRPERSQKCRPGMFFNEKSKLCEDIDECAIRNNGCFESQICVNTRSSFHCVPRQTCRLGFHFNEDTLTCDRFVDQGLPSIIIREVTSVEDSYPMESRNIFFTTKITCLAGFSYDAFSKSCIDINECAQIKPICSHNCKNLHGSYMCICPEGFKLGRDGKTCIDIDECLLSRTICGANVCNNIHGSFICYPPTCPKGYKLYKRQRRNNFSKCSRLFCGDKNKECRKQPKYLTFKNVTMRITADSSPREIVLHNIRKADYKVQMKLRLRVVDMETGKLSMKINHFNLVQQQNRALLILKQPFTTPESLKLVVLVYTGSRNQTIIIEKIYLNYFVENFS